MNSAQVDQLPVPSGPPSLSGGAHAGFGFEYFAEGEGVLAAPVLGAVPAAWAGGVVGGAMPVTRTV